MNRWGPLPPTWRSTNRDDGQGSILYFRVPEGLAWPGQLGPGVEIIQFAHRYAAVWPSIHPEGREYRWVAPDGSATTAVPHPETFPPLPDPWVRGLTGGLVQGDRPHAEYDSAHVGEWLARHGEGEPCGVMQRCLDDYPPSRFDGSTSRHDAARSASRRITALAAEGHSGMTVALAQIERTFTAAVSAGPKRADDPHEWRRMVDGAVQLAAAEPVAGHDPCERFGTSSGRSSTGVSVAPPTLAAIAFHGLLGEIVWVTAGHTEADPAGVLASLLCGAGVLAGPAPHLMIGNTRHPLLIWPLLFGPTGTGRKGEATNTAEAFLVAADPLSFALLRRTGLSSGEGLIEAIRDPTEVKRGKLTETIGTNDKRLFVVEPEFSSVMARAKREGNTLAAVQRQAWEGRVLSVLNRAALIARSSHIGVIGHITAREFRTRLAEAELAGGLYNRYLPFWVERRGLIAMPKPVDPKRVSAFGSKLKEALSASRKHGTAPITLADDAAERWAAEVYPALSMVDDSDEAWTEFTRRAAAYCLRIAGLHAVLDKRYEISLGDLAAAEATVQFGMATAQYVLGSLSRDPRLDRIRRFIDANPDGVTRTEISALFGRHLTAEMLNGLLAAVLEDPRYEEVTVETKGRSATVLRGAKEAN